MISQGCPKCGGGGLIDHPRSGAITCPDKLADCDLCDGGGSVPEVVARRWRAVHDQPGALLAGGGVTRHFDIAPSDDMSPLNPSYMRRLPTLNRNEPVMFRSSGPGKVSAFYGPTSGLLNRFSGTQGAGSAPVDPEPLEGPQNGTEETA